MAWRVFNFPAIRIKIENTFTSLRGSLTCIAIIRNVLSHTTSFRLMVLARNLEFYSS